ncbi:hypothetical protein [Agrococcus sp. SGAir0287]|uniref:PD-(D/E)XK nuclease domain-containing protein n=1 Tax=Agrococcus sp. SGAir0287 TaxID=2070347 RepID=UPI0010CD1D44|nr:hypothetical protein [Agrococcus sp. SGAir0287]QCR19561.1 hypothetical protein C1N71_09095 [Agrococcus sp. SGAir0287]
MSTQDLVRQMRDALARGDRVAAIHYSCESFYDVTDRPVAISAIAVTEVHDSTGGQSGRVFSIAGALAHDDALEREKDLLRRFFEYVRAHADTWWVHWNMDNATYGFEALVTRYRYLFNEDAPTSFARDRLLDLDSAIEARYGSGFANHPKLRSLCTLNGYFMAHFSDGKEEARAFGEGDHGLCERSASAKSSLLAKAAVDLFEGRLQTLNSVGTLEYAGERLDAVRVVLDLGEKFLYVERELKHRHGNRPTLEVSDEHDAQDLFRSLLRVFFEDIRPEDYTPSYAGASSRIDFVIPEIELAIELKFARDTMSDKTLGEELLVDRDRYSGRRDVRHLVCLVFDHDGKLRNPRALEADLARKASEESLAVTVRIFDR